jgi:predicted transglutaminase-like cysteine proteinase
MAKAEEISRQSFWNSREVVSFNLRPFWKWRAVLDRYAREMKGDGGRSCPSSRFGDCPYDEWRRFLSEIASNDRWGQLVAVNGFMNARRYMADEWNWGVKDYWATPGEFLARAGDCEDYAIAKYLSLKELGWAEGDLRLVVVRDAKLRVAHAVLVVAYGGRRWVLDNQTDRINETVDIRHYRPVFSINETSWWHHRASAPATALRTTDGSGSLNATPTAAEYHP